MIETRSIFDAGGVGSTDSSIKPVCRSTIIHQFVQSSDMVCVLIFLLLALSSGLIQTQETELVEVFTGDDAIPSPNEVITKKSFLI